MLIHTKVKDHVCDVCKKKFAVKRSLVNHFRIHLGEKPYGCAKCGIWYTTSASRNHHMRNSHKELSIEQQSELKCKLQKTIVYDYLKRIERFILNSLL